MVQPLFQDKSLRFNTYVSGVIHETVVSDVAPATAGYEPAVERGKIHVRRWSVSLEIGKPHRWNGYGAL